MKKALTLWFSNVREKEAPMSGPLMQQNAVDLAKKIGKSGFTASDAWLQSWRKCENIIFKRVDGEQKDIDLPASENG